MPTLARRCFGWFLAAYAYSSLASAGAAQDSIQAHLAALGGDDAKTRRAAAFELGKQGPAAAEAAPALIEHLEDDEPLVREAAAWALGEIGPQAAAAVDPLLRLCREDARIRNRHMAVKSLGKLGPRAGKAVEFLLSVARGGQGEVGDQPFQPTGRVQPLSHNTRLRTDAIRSLGGIRAKEAVTFLVSVLTTTQRRINQGGAAYYLAAAEALAEIGEADERVIRALEQGARIPPRSKLTAQASEAAADALKKLQAEK